MNKLRVPSTHRLAELLVYAVFGVVAGVILFIMIQWMRGYSVALPRAPGGNVLPVSTAGTSPFTVE